MLAEKPWIFGTDLGSTEEREHTEQLPLARLPCNGNGLGRRLELRPSSNTKDCSVGRQLWGEDEQSAKGQRLCKLVLPSLQTKKPGEMGSERQF